MKNNDYSITVVIPTFNKADFIANAIESVLAQTYKNFEIVIIDDCSTDLTAECVKKYLSDTVRYFQHTVNLGPGATFNDGIEKARTPYVTFLASDDMLQPQHLEYAITEFKNDDEIETVFAQLECIDEQGIKINNLLAPPFTDKYQLLNDLFYSGNNIPCPGVSFKKTLFQRIPAYNPSFIVCHDYDLNIRCLMNTKISVIPAPTVLYRRFSDASNLSGASNWFNLCNSIETKMLLDNYLELNYDDMKNIFPQLHDCSSSEIVFRFLVDTCKNKQVRLSSWAFEKLAKYIERHEEIFEKNTFNFQYKDYIDLYKLNVLNTVAVHTKKCSLLCKMKNAIKKILKIHAS